ncbi:hypothetical protein [Fibrella aquatilis]|uniref:Uncharacterized protein n=1 Tax=Fibrella aquatilis TaxID=2817059 RepID=A0A939G8M2_9BACT|nr:hypothetical protein [Fibrella aquatilis]MBO0932370.1 hypothetical protein [Fibrella aquatilis]
MKTLLIACTALVGFAGCSKKQAFSVEPVNPNRVAQFVGNWVLVAPDATYPITLTIEPTAFGTGTKNSYGVSGKGPVNRYTSSLDYAPSSATEVDMKFSPVFWTSKVAETPQQAQASNDYLTRLGRVKTGSITKEGALYLRSEPTLGGCIDLQVRLIFQRVN